MFTLLIGHKEHTDDFGWPSGDFADSKPVVKVELPATTYELLEAFEKAELDAESKICVCYDVGDFNYLAPNIGSMDDVVMLNEATLKMSDMDDIGLTALIALVQRESDGWKHDIPASRLYDLACSVNKCEVIPEINDVRELGRYYVKNDLIPEVKGLGESIKKALDYDYLGFQVVNETKGIFISDPIGYSTSHKGYVVVKGEIGEPSADLDLSLSPPDYSILVSVRHLPSRRHISLALPLTEEQLRKRLEELEPVKWDEVDYYCRDCRIVDLEEVIRYSIYGEDQSGADFRVLNALARKISDLSNEQAMKYRAAISLRRPRETKEALFVVEELDEYTHLPRVRTHEDYGKYELNRLLEEADAALIMDNINLESYGRELQDNRGFYLTDYGAMERKDCYFIFEIKNDHNWGRSASMSGLQL